MEEKREGKEKVGGGYERERERERQRQGEVEESVREEGKGGERAALTLLTSRDGRMEPVKPGDPTKMGLKRAPCKQGWGGTPELRQSCKTTHESSLDLTVVI